MRFVLDNSVVCGWLLQNQAAAYCDAIAQRHRPAPSVSTGHRPTLAGLGVQQRAAHGMQAPDDIGISCPADAQHAGTVAHRNRNVRTAQPAQLFDLALRYDLTSYGAIYLDLALRHRLPIATQDRDLAHAAQVAGVGVVAD